MVQIDGLTTETVNETTKNIDQLDTIEIVKLINEEDKKVAGAVEKELPNIASTLEPEGLKKAEELSTAGQAHQEGWEP